jgi:hypothetical protein
MIRAIKNHINRHHLYVTCRDWMKDRLESFYRLCSNKREQRSNIGAYNLNIYPYGNQFLSYLLTITKQQFKGLGYQLKTPVASIGTCFAEEFASHMKQSGGNYLYLEKNVFNSSANWGRVYTVPNLLQIIKYSVTDDVPFHIEQYGSSFIDPLRERSVGLYANIKDAQTAILSHRTASGNIFRQTEIMVITLGQNEAWFDKSKNIVWGSIPPSELLKKESVRFSPVQFDFQKNMTDLSLVIQILRSINSKLKIIFTVSPVAAYATFLNDNVITQSFAGKCTLRTCVQEVIKKYDEVYYFPSFEIVLSNNPRNFCADNRHVKRHCVNEIFSILDSSLKA